MFHHRGGESVKSGFYWNVTRREIVTVSRGAGVLPGGEAHRYIKLPTLLVLGFAPLMGLLYIIFLPFAGFAMVLDLAGRKMGRALRKAALEVKTMVSEALRA